MRDCLRKKLTTRHKQILSFIRVFKANSRLAPSVRESGNSLVIKSPTGVYGLLKVIEAKGPLKRNVLCRGGLR
ncbi:LexA family transcriptional regulator [Gimesia chilikensis]|uniref:LexA family protein n=1 Tax=Gimesia chilikensis TaxID=2605989 RepID=UPI0011ED7B0D|nr:LexA family transcriptional regulator [Gimesia chilikensis]